MAASIQCKCVLSNEHRWDCQWSTLSVDAKTGLPVAFSVAPSQFISIITYLERILNHHDLPIPRPDLGPTTIRLRYRRNAKLYELQVRAGAGGLNAMVDEPQLVRVLNYHKSCLQAYAVAIYEGRVPVPEGYPEGYPEPRWG
jgi:hypothetical protein